MEKRFSILFILLFFFILIAGCIKITPKTEKPNFSMTYFDENGSTNPFIKTYVIKNESLINETESIELIIKFPEKNIPNESLDKDIEDMEKEVFELVNAERKNYGLNELKWNDELAYVARKHSKYLASLNRGFKKTINISHKDQNGEFHDKRLNRAGIYYFSASAENIFGISIVKSYYKINNSPAEFYDINELPERAINEWMLSKGHRENILNPEFDETGVGIARDETGTNYIFTQVFIKRATCGYRYGKCCEKKGYYPYCFIELKCINKVCVKDEDIIESTQK